MVMASISMIVVFFVLQRHIVAGLLAGSSTG
jgi:ABC-type glycerol-3-phosphate transport system permease component